MTILLMDLCNDKRFNSFQIRFFWHNVLKIFSKNYFISPFEIGLECLRNLWIIYDLGGISVGRSLRSVLLDLAIDLLKYRYLEDLDKVIGILVAMYHSQEYINKNNWYDFDITFEDLPMRERILLVSAAISFGTKVVPDIDTCTEEYIWEVINTAKEKVRLTTKTD